MRTRIVRTVVWSGLMVHAASGLVWAQKDARPVDDDSGMLQWGVALGLGVAICLSGMLNAKRSHLA